MIGASPTAATEAEVITALRGWIQKDQVISIALRPGEVIRGDRIGSLAEVIPPGLLDSLRFPEFELEIQEQADLSPHEIFVKATNEHAAKTSLAADGSMQGYVAGQPFTHDRILEASADEAGIMIAWNNIHRWDSFGYRTQQARNYFMRPSGLDSNPDLPEFFTGGGSVLRSIGIFYHRVFLSHVPMLADQNYQLDVSGGGQLLYKDYLELLDPFDVAGTRMVIERSLDAHEADQVNSYLPTERRVRRLSSRERADSWLGSEMTLDDFEGFSGRVLDYEWSLLGEKSILAVADLQQETVNYFGPLSNIPNDRWQLRDCYVLESIPIWKGHPYSTRILFIDKQTSLVRLSVVADREGRLWKIIFSLYDWTDAAGEQPELHETVSSWKGTVAIDLINNRSTVAHGNTDHPVMPAAKVRRMFSASNLNGGR
ncbi:MAG: DUF1329 domain-containing protein [Gammaproteobacteria bacterium]